MPSRKTPQAGIFPNTTLIFGYPGETLDDILATIRLVRTARPDDIGISISYPLPGTSFYKSVVDQIGVKSNWQDSEDLGVIFQAEFGTSFYRKLHKVLHQELELIQQIEASTCDSDAKYALSMILAINDDWFELALMAKTGETS